MSKLKKCLLVACAGLGLFVIGCSNNPMSLESDQNSDPVKLAKLANTPVTSGYTGYAICTADQGSFLYVYLDPQTKTKFSSTLKHNDIVLVLGTWYTAGRLWAKFEMWGYYPGCPYPRSHTVYAAASYLDKAQ